MGKKTYDFPLNLLIEKKITDFIYKNSNNSLFSSYFPSNLKNADITPVVLKNIVKMLKTTVL